MNLLPTPRSLQRRPGSFLLPKPVGVQASAGPGITLKRELQQTPDHPEGYTLTISKSGIEIHFRENGGLRAAMATLRQLLREYGRKLPCLKIRDWPDFPRRGVMLDISRGRVPKLATLLELVEKLADFKINEFQLYTEHTIANTNPSGKTGARSRPGKFNSLTRAAANSALIWCPTRIPSATCAAFSKIRA
jgi:hypothetical protein